MSEWTCGLSVTDKVGKSDSIEKQTNKLLALAFSLDLLVKKI